MTVSEKGLSKTVLPFTWQWRWDDIRALDVAHSDIWGSDSANHYYLVILLDGDAYIPQRLVRERMSPLRSDLYEGDVPPERERWACNGYDHPVKQAIVLPRYTTDSRFGEAIIAVAEAHGVEVTDKARHRLLHPEEYGDYGRPTDRDNTGRWKLVKELEVREK